MAALGLGVLERLTLEGLQGEVVEKDAPFEAELHQFELAKVRQDSAAPWMNSVCVVIQRLIRSSIEVCDEQVT